MNDSFPQSDPPALDERLVAYLDGELDAAAARAVEESLTDDRVRQRLRELQHTWDALDALPTTALDETFTRTTVEMAAVEAETALAAEQAAAPRRRRRDWLIAGGAAVATGLAAYFIVARQTERPNAALLRDLLVIERLDAYRSVESVGYLRKLHEAELFPEAPSDDN